MTTEVKYIAPHVVSLLKWRFFSEILSGHVTCQLTSDVRKFDIEGAPANYKCMYTFLHKYYDFQSKILGNMKIKCTLMRTLMNLIF